MAIVTYFRTKADLEREIEYLKNQVELERRTRELAQGKAEWLQRRVEREDRSTHFAGITE